MEFGTGIQGYAQGYVKAFAVLCSSTEQVNRTWCWIFSEPLETDAICSDLARRTTNLVLLMIPATIVAYTCAFVSEAISLSGRMCSTCTDYLPSLSFSKLINLLRPRTPIDIAQEALQERFLEGIKDCFSTFNLPFEVNLLSLDITELLKYENNETNLIDHFEGILNVHLSVFFSRLERTDLSDFYHREARKYSKALVELSKNYKDPSYSEEGLIRARVLDPLFSSVPNHIIASLFQEASFSEFLTSILNSHNFPAEATPDTVLFQRCGNSYFSRPYFEWDLRGVFNSENSPPYVVGIKTNYSMPLYNEHFFPFFSIRINDGNDSFSSLTFIYATYGTTSCPKAWYNLGYTSSSGLIIPEKTLFPGSSISDRKIVLTIVKNNGSIPDSLVAGINEAIDRNVLN